MSDTFDSTNDPATNNPKSSEPSGSEFASPSTVPNSPTSPSVSGVSSGGSSSGEEPTAEHRAVDGEHARLGGAFGPPQQDRQTAHQSDDFGYSNEPHSSTSGKWRWIAVAAIAALIGGLIGGGVGAAVGSASDTPRRADRVSSGGGGADEVATPNNIREVLEQVQPAVVAIAANGASGQGTGTGMVVSTDGEILTNNHVIAGASRIMVTFSDETTPREARLLGTDSTIDTALLKVDNPPANLTTVRFANSSETQVGDDVIAIGNALALTGGPSVTSGIVSAKDRSIADSTASLDNLIQTDTAINPGNSGGPLVNMNGEVVGMNTAVIRGSTGEFENIGFAIAIDSVKPVIEDLRKGVRIAPAFLGLTSVTMTESIRERFELTPREGAVVSQVIQGSPADDAGLARYDVVTRIGDKDVKSSEDLALAVRSYRPNDEVRVTYYRGERQQEAQVRLTNRPVSQN